MSKVMTVTASELRQRCFSLLDEVAEGELNLVVTKRGRPIARVVRVAGDSLEGTVRYLVPEEELLQPVDFDPRGTLW